MFQGDERGRSNEPVVGSSRHKTDGRVTSFMIVGNYYEKCALDVSGGMPS